ncbi:DUF4148 domain-containing protein [Bordetella holmesii]|uniref:PF13663 domain protein n=2 Tax=Bordetella holmesii TaxID=35814 RepID=A0A158M1B0_9BORD|nr:DUF4148 domain-containing protein [Bordetella holmesii]AMD49476.1 hypothetical protein F783_012180 [Bordetella holmesii F627]AUL21120.1 hypothetical protein BTL46_17810 [Bordetella holmesii]AUL24457.1 hypothetical protein BTL48_17830 [Bordetella holmesii]AUL27787.1 hypothetical protein BTL49_17905 [Bordetella holmesii]AUL31130.1 hypothetical protein BTL50_17900 [Bordetella holmesii]
MKSLATAVMLSMAVMAGAQAADVEPSRAQVQAELAQAKTDGQYTFGEEAYPAAIVQHGSLSSAQVQDQLAQAQSEGLVTTANLDYPPVAATVDSHVSRAQVRSDLAQAKAEGLVTYGNLDYPPLNG